eukprot:7379520-Prymnesium_polylepis.1
MTCDVMRAAIAFKWQAYGRTKWRSMVFVSVVYFATYIISVFMLLNEQDEMDSGVTNESLTMYTVVAIVLFAITSV